MTSPLLTRLLALKKQTDDLLCGIRDEIRVEGRRLAFEAYGVKIGSLVEHRGARHVVYDLGGFDNCKPSVLVLGKEREVLDLMDDWTLITPRT